MSQLCTRCGMPVRPGFKFCNVCGEPVSEDSPETSGVVSYSPLLGEQGRAVRLLTGQAAGRCYSVYPALTIGSGPADAVFDDDSTMSPLHARVESRGSGAVLQDMGSLNGVFLRATDKTLLHDNDIIRAGDHFFLFESLTIERFVEDTGTEFYASPCRGECFRLVEILRGGRRGRACMAPDGGIVVGRTEGDFTFPEDEKMSPRHFTIRWTQRGGILIDKSANGTFVQIHEETSVARQSLFFVGERLFEVV